MEDRHFDVIVIGAGPAGCRVAALLAENQKRTALVDRMPPGGTCLRSGCIPTKKLSLAAARLRENMKILYNPEAAESAAGRLREKREQEEQEQQEQQILFPTEDGSKTKGGFKTEESFCAGRERELRQKAWEYFLEETSQMTKEMTEGIRLVQMSRRVRLLEGESAFPEIAPEGLKVMIGGENYYAKDIVLAVGSAPMIPAAVSAFLQKNPAAALYTTDTLWEMKRLPDRLIVIGGGTAGCEIADAMSAFVPRVELYEAGEEILLSWSREPRRTVRRILERHGVELYEGCGSSDAWMDKILSKDPEGSQKSALATAIVIAAGREPVFSGKKASACGLRLTQEGFIEADSRGRTANPRIFCVGDANGQERTAYYGTWQAVQAAKLILSEEADRPEERYDKASIDRKTGSGTDLTEEWDSVCAPVCLHTDPPAACVGMTMEQIRAGGYIIRKGRAPVYASGAARMRGCTEGSVTIWRDVSTDLLLGACVAAPGAEELIHLLQSYILWKIPCRQIRRQVFAHPSLSELVRMAVEDSCGGAPDLPLKHRR